MLITEYYQNYLQNNPHPRQLIATDTLPGHAHAKYIIWQKRKLINFAGNDYLGLAKHPLLISRSKAYAEKYGVGATASRLVTGNLNLYTALENKLAQAIGKPASLIFSSGFGMNVAVLTALLDERVLGQKALVFSDHSCHASMITGVKHVAHLRRFQHNNLFHLEKLLQKYQHTQQPKFILIESTYSMSGDQADLPAIIQLAKQYNAFLYIDEAHSIGVYDHTGWGLAQPYANDVDLIMGTFSKALGSYGAYIACSEKLREYLINTCRGLIYSTGLSPMNLGAITAGIELLPTLQKERQHIWSIAAQLRQFFLQQKLNIGTSTTHIIPWIFGDAKTAFAAHALLIDHGFLTALIRPPSVAPGQSRLRLCLSAMHNQSDLQALQRALLAVKNTLGISHNDS
jgi:8-amino-7-oxononanoate synthase